MDSEEIKARLKARGLKQVDLANALGLAPNKVTKSLNGTRQWSAREILNILALLGDGTPVAGAAARQIPLIGQVAAGNWREAVQATTTFMPSPDPTLPTGTFALTVSGDSMDRYVEDGGTVIVDPSDKALYPGRFYVITNSDGEATFKRFAVDPARLVPCSSNPAHREIVIGGDEGFAIVGRVLWRASRM